MMKIKYLILSTFLIGSANVVYGQQKLKDNTVQGSPLPNKDAVLELESNKRGLLHARLNLVRTTDASPLTAHVAGMMVYNTATTNDVKPGIYYNDGNKWIVLTNGFAQNIAYDPVLNKITFIDGTGAPQTVDLKAIVKANETLTLLVANPDGTLSYTDEKGVKKDINLPGLIKTHETESVLKDNGDGTFTFTNERGTAVKITLTAGKPGSSAYELAKAGGYLGTEASWLLSLKGATGATGAVGAAGKSAYEIWESIPANNGKSQGDYLTSLVGATGAIGATGAVGANGKSAYEIWESIPANNGKSQADYLTSLIGATGATGAVGANGKSAYEIWESIPANNGKSQTDYLTSLVGATGAIGATGAVGATGTAGVNGKSVLNGSGAATGGSDGDFFLNTTTNTLYGPKAGGAWPSTGVSLVGATGAPGAPGAPGATGAVGATGAIGATGAVGATGAAGVDGKSVLNGSGAATGGSDGDFFLNTTTNTLYGPKAGGVWPSTGVPLVGATGATGAVGATGATGVDGKGVLNGSGAATGGSDGDFFLNTTTNTLYGPKVGGAWPSTGVSLVGPAGPAGSAGADGKSIINGTVPPVAGDGKAGDFYLNTVTNILYGPKNETTGWPATGVPLSGPKFFYMPPVIFDTSTPGATVIKRNLYQEFKAQFTGVEFIKNDATGGAAGVALSDTFVSSTGTAIPAVHIPAVSALDYYITYYDKNAIEIVSLGADGILTYKVKANATAATYMNIVFVIK